MRAIRAGKGLVETAIPAATSNGDVLMRVQAAGVNRPDVLQNLGLYPARPGMTDILGLEVAGTVVESKDKRWKEGDSLCALVSGGGYAEYCKAKGSHCLPVPKGKTIEEAAGLPETVFTVWKNLFWDGPNTLKGKSLLIHGGSSGIGTTAIAMAKAFGASAVQTTVGSEAKRQACLTLGADMAFNYKEEAWEEKADKVDVVLDMVGGDYLQKNLGVMRDGGRLVIIGFLGSPVSHKVNMTRVLLKSLHITGSVLRSAPDEVKSKLCEEIEAHVWPLLESGDLSLPLMSKVYDSLEKYEEAHKDMQTSSHIGKLVMQVNK